MNKRKRKKLNLDRKGLILSAIIEEFFFTSAPVASKKIVEEWEIKASPATVRNDMSLLEEESLIFSPHTSAGRVPTSKGYRKFVDNFLDLEDYKNEVEKAFTKRLDDRREKRIRDKVYDIVSLLAEVTGEVSFATLPGKRAFYLGISRILKKPEFISNPEKSSEIIEVLEGGGEFINFLELTPLVKNEVKIVIGEENIIPQIKSCSLVFSKYEEDGFSGFFGILGPVRMEYGFINASVKFALDNFWD